MGVISWQTWKRILRPDVIYYIAGVVTILGFLVTVWAMVFAEKDDGVVSKVDVGGHRVSPVPEFVEHKRIDEGVFESHE